MPITKYMQNQAAMAAKNAIAANTKKLFNSVITSHVDGVAAYSNKGMTVDIMRMALGCTPQLKVLLTIILAILIKKLCLGEPILCHHIRTRPDQ